MIEQRGLARVVYDSQRNVTRREWCLQEMDRAIRLATLPSLAAPHSTKPGRSCRPLPLEVIRRIYCLQQWFDLSDPQAEEMRYDRESMRCFARVELGEDPVPDESTIVQRHHLLEARQLTAQMFDAVRDLLGDRDLLVTTGTIIDATWIAAPSSTKNATRTRDPEVRQTRKGTSWYFGMKGHIGTDLQIGCPTGLTDGPPPASLPHGDHRFPRPSRRANATRPVRQSRAARGGGTGDTERGNGRLRKCLNSSLRLSWHAY